MKTPDVLREFDERFPYRVRADHCNPEEMALMNKKLTLVTPKEIKAFIQEKLNERGEMIAKEIEKGIKEFLDERTGTLNQLVEVKNASLRYAASISRSYKE